MIPVCDECAEHGTYRYPEPTTDGPFCCSVCGRRKAYAFWSKASLDERSNVRILEIVAIMAAAVLVVKMISEAARVILFRG